VAKTTITTQKYPGMIENFELYANTELGAQ
jgi:hypothetical protein